ncbi:MAG: DUF1540 domain-containing protein [Clostridia bacterium]|nr:DUF1540 domain-containing protein [Clostridia bacterium]
MSEKRPINGISCDCSACRFHSGSSCCCAPRIKVGPSSADSSQQTCCDTFQPRK